MGLPEIKFFLIRSNSSSCVLIQLTEKPVQFSSLICSLINIHVIFLIFGGKSHFVIIFKDCDVEIAEDYEILVSMACQS